MSHDRGCPKCFEDDRGEYCTDQDCWYGSRETRDAAARARRIDMIKWQMKQLLKEYESLVES